MAVPTKYYIDSSVASDAGDGTIGTPWTRADQNPVQHALDTLTRDATDGDEIIDVAATSDNLLAARRRSLPPQQLTDSHFQDASSTMEVLPDW